MKNIIPPTNGKIIRRGLGAGELTQTEIDERAAEIASIEDHHRVTEDDLQQARRELMGEDTPVAREEEESVMSSLSRDPSDPPSIRGSQTPNYESGDDQKNVESLVMEGVEEAEHEQMLEARRRRETND